MRTDSGHRGDDLCAAEGTEIYAAADGVVLAAQEHYSWGNFVEIDHGADADGLRWVHAVRPHAVLRRCRPGRP